MSIYRLKNVFSPNSIALIGASPRESSVGRKILHNIFTAGFAGPVYLVNPRHPNIDGIGTFAAIENLPAIPDLVVITAPAPEVPEIVRSAGAKGCAGAVIVTSGLGHGPHSLLELTVGAARAHGLRLIGPNCIGIMNPLARMNASFTAHEPKPGNLALISQSGAVAAGMVEWAARRAVGFSGMISLGDQADVDLADCLDYFATDSATRAILVYIEGIVDARRFMSAASAAAREKPIIIIKSGRNIQSARAAATHTGALAGSDAVYDAAFRRAGLLRVRGLAELFAAAETLGRIGLLSGKRLAILTNGGGLGVLAVDRLVDLGGQLATLSDDTLAALNATMPSTWSNANPVDIGGDADAVRYEKALTTLLADGQNDAVLVMNVPTALASPIDIAKSIVALSQKECAEKTEPKPILAVWVGEDQAAADILEAGGIANFFDESQAIEGFTDLARYSEAQDQLMQTPSNLISEFSADVEAARRIVRNVIDRNGTWLNPIEVASLLKAYAIPMALVFPAHNAVEAVAAAEPILAAGQSVVVKIMSPDIVHKSDIGGVRLNLTSAKAVAEATDDILSRARAAKPDARFVGVTIHPMIQRPRARELIAGIASDPTFGPIIAFGAGGTAVEVINDKALALPPLNGPLARDLMARTRIARLLRGYRDVPPAAEDAVALVLLKLAQLVADIPEVRELDLNPLLADENGVIVTDARVAVRAVG